MLHICNTVQNVCSEASSSLSDDQIFASPRKVYKTLSYKHQALIKICYTKHHINFMMSEYQTDYAAEK